jgi:hypothetical protein
MGINDPVGAAMVLAANDVLRSTALRLAVRSSSARSQAAPAKSRPVTRVEGIGERVDVRL